jgi:tetratricopeptide (TPR) repeat protein
MITPTARRFTTGAMEALGVLTLAAILALAIGLARGSQPATRSQAAEQVLDMRSAGERAVEQAQRKLAARPQDAAAMAGLANAYLVRARETADPSYYSKADALVQSAISADAGDPDAVLAAGTLALTRHEFVAALSLGQRAVQLTPYRPAAYGVLTDALVELGRYDEAVVAAQQMVDLRPDQTSFSRVSYLRELHGDLDGAIDAMRQAVAAGAPHTEATAWSEVQLGNLLFARGELVGAEESYREAGVRIQNYVPALAGRARVRVATGDLVGAADLYTQAVQALPLAEYAIALGDVYAKLGSADDARTQFQLVEAIDRLFAANGVRTDLELAVFQADHGGDLDAALAAVRAEHATRPSVPVTDALAWIEYRAGELDDALVDSRAALRLGTRDPLILYHAGVIAQASGDGSRARELLAESSALNPRFSVLWAEDLAARLESLGLGGGVE